MEEQGIPADGGPIGMMLMEHEHGRAYVRAMSACIARVQSKDGAAIDSLLSDAKDYIRLLREHIQKEDEILFPMAYNVIPPDEHKRLLDSFAEHEAVEMGAQTHDYYLEIARELERSLRS
jgi:hemerythrin-like domain-containing protein